MPFVKGKSGNPGGKPKGIAAAREYIAKQTKNGAEMVRFHLSVMRGEAIELPREDGEESTKLAPLFRDRQASADWLADRLWGKSAQTVTGEDGGDLVIRVVKYGGAE